MWKKNFGLKFAKILNNENISLIIMIFYKIFLFMQKSLSVSQKKINLFQKFFFQIFFLKYSRKFTQGKTTISANFSKSKPFLTMFDDKSMTSGLINVLSSPKHSVLKLRAMISSCI